MYLFPHLKVRACWISVNCNQSLDCAVILLSVSDEITRVPKNNAFLKLISPHPSPHQGPCTAGAGGQRLPAEPGGQPPQAVGAHWQGGGVQGVRPVPGEGRRHRQNHIEEQEAPQEVPTHSQTPTSAHHAAWTAHHHCLSCSRVSTTKVACPSPYGQVRPAPTCSSPHAPACHDQA